jgi:hypothetical protein
VSPPDPVFLATAVEIVLKAGDIQLARRESGFHVDKKGTIDLVTEVDLECERMCRATLAERFPDHDILAEEMSRDPRQPSTSKYRWVYDPLDGTTNYAHGLPIFCSSLALQIDGRTEVGAVYDPTRAELLTAERHAGAFLNGQRLQVSASTSRRGISSRCSAHSLAGRAPCVVSGPRPSTCATSRPGDSTDIGSNTSGPGMLLPVRWSSLKPGARSPAWTGANSILRPRTSSRRMAESTTPCSA